LLDNKNTLVFERSLRKQLTLNELSFFIAHETSVFLDSDMIAVWSCKGGKNLKLRSISGVTQIETRNVYAQNFARFINLSCKNLKIREGNVIFFLDRNNLSADIVKYYPDNIEENFAICVFIDSAGTYIGGFLISVKQRFSANQIEKLKFVQEIYNYSWLMLSRLSFFGNKKSFTSYKKPLSIFGLLFILCLLIRVPQTVIAPVVINAKDTYIISTPMEGVIEDINVDSEQKVHVNDVLISMEKRDLMNANKLAKRELETAIIRYRTMVNSSFDDIKNRSEINILKSEMREKELEVKYTGMLLKQADIKSPVNGVTIISDHKEWRGRPVVTGEKILEVADPKKVEANISLPVSEALNFKPNDKVKIYLSSNPLDVINAKIRYINFYATDSSKNILAYEVYADLDKGASIPRIGSEGTAKLIGDKVSLFYYLFRKPITFVRQKLGW
jgi:hypothetical protein